MEEKEEDQDLTTRRTRSSVLARSATRSTSYGGQDGYSAFQEPPRTRTRGSSTGPPAAMSAAGGPEGGAESDDGAADEDPFMVRWDAGDPLDPRGASPARKWAVVLVVAACSLCM